MLNRIHDKLNSIKKTSIINTELEMLFSLPRFSYPEIELIPKFLERPIRHLIYINLYLPYEIGNAESRKGLLYYIYIIELHRERKKHTKWSILRLIF